MKQIQLSHGGGGEETNNLIHDLFYHYFSNDILIAAEDAAVLEVKNKIAFTTDSFTVSPIFFNGGNIGKLVIAGTVNDLFQKSRSSINEHIKNIYAKNELIENNSMKKFGNSEFAKKPTQYYNLDVIISVGYRVKYLQGTKFRQWATGRLKEYIVKGFTMNDELLKEAGGGNYFEELLARIRDIRSSEKVFWRKVLDIYATSIGYDAKVKISMQFFQTVQNKMYWVVYCNPAAEIVYQRVDCEKPYMGLTNFNGVFDNG